MPAARFTTSEAMKSGVELATVVSKPAPLSAAVRAPRRIATPDASAGMAQTIRRRTRSGRRAGLGVGEVGTPSG